MWNLVIAVLPLALAFPLTGAPAADGPDDGKGKAACAKEGCADLFMKGAAEGCEAVPDRYGQTLLLDAALGTLEGDDDDIEALRKQIQKLAEQSRGLQRELRRIQKTLGEIVDEHGGRVQEFFEEMLEETIPKGPGRKAPKGPPGRGPEGFRVIPGPDWDVEKDRWGKAVREYVKQWGDRAGKQIPQLLPKEFWDDGCPRCRECPTCKARSKKGKALKRAKVHKKAKVHKGKVQKKGKVLKKAQPLKKEKRLRLYRPGEGQRRLYIRKGGEGDVLHLDEDGKVFRFDPKVSGKGKIIIEKDGKRIEKVFDLDDHFDLQELFDGMEIDIDVESMVLPQGGSGKVILRRDLECGESCGEECGGECDDCDGECEIRAFAPGGKAFGPGKIVVGDRLGRIFYVSPGCSEECDGECDDCDGECEIRVFAPGGKAIQLDEIFGGDHLGRIFSLPSECGGDCEDCDEDCDRECDDCDGECEECCPGEWEECCPGKCGDAPTECEIRAFGPGGKEIKIRGGGGLQWFPEKRCEVKSVIEKKGTCTPDRCKSSFF